MRGDKKNGGELTAAGLHIQWHDSPLLPMRLLAAVERRRHPHLPYTCIIWPHAMSRIDAERESIESAYPLVLSADMKSLVAHELKELTFEWGDSYDEKVLTHS